MLFNSFAPHSTPWGKYKYRHLKFMEESGAQRGEVVVQGHKARKEPGFKPQEQRLQSLLLSTIP